MKTPIDLGVWLAAGDCDWVFRAWRLLSQKGGGQREIRGSLDNRLSELVLCYRLLSNYKGRTEPCMELILARIQCPTECQGGTGWG